MVADGPSTSEGRQPNNLSLCQQAAAVVVRVLRKCRAGLPVAWTGRAFMIPDRNALNEAVA